MIWPKKLKEGDKILLTSFSSTSIKPEELTEKVTRFEAENKVKIHIDSSLLGTRSRHENLAKYRQKMTNCINNIDLHDISALLSIRGGWSITDMLLNNKVDLDNLIDKIIGRKAMVLGYSDNTLISDYINLKYGYVTYHSPNFEGFYTWSQKSQDLVSKLLKESVEASIDLKPMNDMAKQQTKASGILVSSNLECLTLSLTFTDKIVKEIKDKGVILLLEDIEVEPSLAFRYIEVILMRFKNEDIKVNGIIFGKFPYCIEDSYISWQGKSFKEVLPHLIPYLDMPIYETNQVGHNETEEGHEVAEAGRGPKNEEALQDYLTTPNGGDVEIIDNTMVYKL